MPEQSVLMTKKSKGDCTMAHQVIVERRRASNSLCRPEKKAYYSAYRETLGALRLVGFLQSLLVKPNDLLISVVG